MATAMHNQSSIAYRMFRQKISEKSDAEALTLAKVALAEHIEATKLAEPNRALGFTRTAREAAEWALTELGDIRKYDIPPICHETRMYMCGLVLGGWMIGGRQGKRYASVIRDWPREEAPAVARLLRKNFEDASMSALVAPDQVIEMFFDGAEEPQEDNEIWRTVVKALGRWSNMAALYQFGRMLHILHSGDPRGHELLRMLYAKAAG